jgi:hypothetical protein
MSEHFETCSKKGRGKAQRSLDLIEAMYEKAKAGDFDPSGLYMSEEDLPKRLDKYEGYHITVERIALTREQARGLPSFPATDKRKDPRYRWFSSNYGDRFWELDAMDPNDLRDCVEAEIKKLIEPVAWQRCEVINRAEQESLKDVFGSWGRP